MLLAVGIQIGASHMMAQAFAAPPQSQDDDFDLAERFQAWCVAKGIAITVKHYGHRYYSVMAARYAHGDLPVRAMSHGTTPDEAVKNLATIVRGKGITVNGGRRFTVPAFAPIYAEGTGPERTRWPGCQEAEDHDPANGGPGCYGELWQCAQCDKTICYAVGTDSTDGGDLCNGCYGKRAAEHETSVAPLP